MSTSYISFTIFLIIFWVFPIQETPQSNVVHITLPKGSKSLTWAEHYSYMLKNFKISPTLENDLKCYDLDGIIIIFWDKVLDGSEKDQVKGVAEMNASSLEAIDELELIGNLKFSKISKINSINYSLSILCIDDSYVFNFDSEYKNHKAISGRMVCKKKDVKKAERVFKSLLESIRFR